MGPQRRAGYTCVPQKNTTINNVDIVTESMTDDSRSDGEAIGRRHTDTARKPLLQLKEMSSTQNCSTAKCDWIACRLVCVSDIWFVS